MFLKKLLTIVLFAFVSLNTTAGVYQDKLSECLVNKTSAEESQNLTV